jgi:hypothetical protein
LLGNVLRANAIEKQGDPATATSQLFELLHATPSLQVALPKLRDVHRTLDLCPTSIPAVLAR